MKGPIMTTLRPPSAPWWKHGHVWLVISGPAAVVVASAVTVFLTLKYPDAVISTQTGVQAVTQAARQATPYSTPRQPVHDSALAPALEGRNHAATPDRFSGSARP